MSGRESYCRNDFYRAFEDRFRGSRELIKGRLEIYGAFVEPLQVFYGEAPAVDLGCGRGEWLELLGERGFEAVGVDLDEGMLAACEELGLNAVKQDATEFLKSLPDESQCVVSGFHIAEHIPFSALQVVVADALRVLKPGGLLILETPNPENVVVGTTSFYLDPTHKRPIPPLLLQFLPEYYGFERVRVLRLQEPPELVDKEDVVLTDVLYGASPDYAVVAQKTAAREVLSAFDAAFDRLYGLDFESLANRFDAALDRRFALLEQQSAGVEGAPTEAEKLLDRFASLYDRLLAEAVHAERNRATVALLAEQLGGANTRLHAAEGELATLKDRVEHFESRATAAESCVCEVEARLAVAEERADALERRAVAAETEAAEQEYRAGLAQAFVQELELRVVEAETRAVGLEARVVDTEISAGQHQFCAPVTDIQLNDLKHRVVAALMQVKELEQRAIAAETRVGELEYGVFEADGRAEELERKVTAAVAEVTESEARAEAHAQKLQVRLVAYENQAEELECRVAAAEAEATAQKDRATRAQARLEDVTSIVGSLQVERDELKSALAAAHGSAHYWRLESDGWHERLLTIHRSSSWRITAPVRAAKRIMTGEFSPIQRAAELITKGVRRAFRPPAVAAARAALSHPRLRSKVSIALRQYPALRQHLVLFVRNAGLVPAVGTIDSHTSAQASRFSVSLESKQSTIPVEPDLSDLSANARRIYADLKAALEQKKRDT